MIVFATGFDAVTGTLRSMDIRGKGGATATRFETEAEGLAAVVRHGKRLQIQLAYRVGLP